MKHRLWWVLFAALLVIGVGLVAIHTAGGSRALIIAQGVAGLAAVGIAAGLAIWKPQPGDRTNWVLGGLALLFMASPLLGNGLEGAHRWIGVGPIQIQPAALSLPVLVWLATRGGSKWLGPGLLAAAAALCALQPDQQAATGVAAGLAGIVLLYGLNPLWLAALGAGIASWNHLRSASVRRAGPLC